MKIMITKKNLVNTVMICLLVLYSIYSMEPYFTWKTYKNGLFGYLFDSIPFRTIFALLFLVLFLIKYSKRIKVQRIDKILAIGTIICALVLVGLSGGVENTHILSMAWVPYLVVASYMLLPSDIKVKTYNLYFFIFSITLILPIIYYILLKGGIKIPFTILEPQETIKVMRGFYYKNYFLAVQRTHRYDLLSELKMCGIFDESGRLGTLSALFLISDHLRIKDRWQNILCLVAGVFSFSLAFYIIIVIYYLGMCVFNRKIKNLFIIFLVFIFYLIFINIDFQDSTLQNLQNRFSITDEGLAGDNRTNDQFDKLIQDFNENSNIYQLLFGNGDGAIAEIQSNKNIDGSSYKCFIYNYGYLGFSFIIIWLILYSLLKCDKIKSKEAKAHIFSLTLAYLLNIYQRPTSFNLGYMLILLGAVELTIKEERVIQNETIIEK